MDELFLIAEREMKELRQPYVGTEHIFLAFLKLFGNEFITLLKETSIVGYVAIQDLTKAADFIISRTYEAFYPLIAIAIIYFVLVWGLTQLLATVERRMRQSDLR